MAEILTDEIDFSEYLRETDAKSKVKPASAWMLELIALLQRLRQKRIRGRSAKRCSSFGPVRSRFGRDRTATARRKWSAKWFYP